MKKFRKVLATMVALTLGTTSTFALSACDDKNHEHSYSWSVVDAADCEHDGLEKGVCQCGDEQTRVVDKGHTYGDWQIAKRPSPDKAGKAVKVCGRDSDHIIEAELPVLTTDGAGYDNYKESDNGSGVPTRTYTLKKAGFEDIVLPMNVAFNVDEAVMLGVYNNDKVVGGDVRVANKSLTSVQGYLNAGGSMDNLTDEMLDVPAEFSGSFYAINNAHTSFEFGDDYVGITDGNENVNRYYTKMPDGWLFPVKEQWVGGGLDANDNPIPVTKQVIKDLDPSEEFFNGYGFFFTWFNGAVRQYGVGNFLNWLYSYGQQAEANDKLEYTQSVTSNDDGDIVCSFAFNSYVTAYGEHLCFLSVDFTLDDEGVIKEFNASCKVYVNETALKTFDETTFKVFSGKEGLWKSYESYSVTQTKEYGEDGKPFNPYKYEDMLVTGYTFTVNNQPVSNATNTEAPDEEVQPPTDPDYTPDNDEYVDISTPDATEAPSALKDPVTGVYTFNPNSVVYVVIDNIEPADTYNLYFDEFKFLVYDESGENFIEEIIMDQNRSNEGHFFGNFSNETEIMTFRSLLAGDFTLVIKTENIEKSIKVHVPFVAPTGFAPNIYVVDEIENDNKWLVPATEQNIYAGQHLSFTSIVDHPFYQDGSFTATVKNSSGALVEGAITESVLEGKDVSVFCVDDPGTYTVTLKSNLGNATSSFTVKVKQAPSAADLFKGTYEFTDKAYTVKFENGKVTVDMGGAVTTAGFAYNSETNKVTVSNATGGTLASGFDIEVTEQFNLFITYKNQFGKSSRYYLSQGAKNNLLGVYTIASSVDAATALEVNVAGTYKITLPGSLMFFYKVNDGANQLNSSDMMNFKSTVTVTLNEGDVLRFWSGAMAGKTVEITMVE